MTYHQYAGWLFGYYAYPSRWKNNFIRRSYMLTIPFSVLLWLVSMIMFLWIDCIWSVCRAFACMWKGPRR